MAGLRAALLFAVLILPAGAGARVVVRVPPDAATPVEPVALTALRCAVAAEASGLAADVADWPGRAELALTRQLDAALPEPLRTRARVWTERALAVRAAVRTVTTAGSALHDLAARAGGPLAAADRVLDAAALATAAVMALRFARRPRTAARR